MGRLIAIGDIHGRLTKLEDLVEQIGLKTDDTLVFLGDYIDRGAHSYEVVEYVIQLKKNFPDVITLRGFMKILSSLCSWATSIQEIEKYGLP